MSILGPHARVQLAGAVEDVLSLEVHDVDWPPPVTPPLARVRFDGAQYFKMPTYSEEFVVARAFPFRAWASLRGTVLRSWSLSRELASSDAVLFRFEPARFGASAGYVVATGVEVSVPKPRYPEGGGWGWCAATWTADSSGRLNCCRVNGDA